MKFCNLSDKSFETDFDINNSFSYTLSSVILVSNIFLTALFHKNIWIFPSVAGSFFPIRPSHTILYMLYQNAEFGPGVHWEHV